jgi:hypothetical protein
VRNAGRAIRLASTDCGVLPTVCGGQIPTETRSSASTEPRFYCFQVADRSCNETSSGIILDEA